MKCIDFDKKFSDYTAAWLKAHSKEYKTYEALEAAMPDVYLQFLNAPAPWLAGITPGAYFSQFDDIKDLVDWLCEYVNRGIAVPDLLLNRIVEIGKPAEKRLVAVLDDQHQPAEAKMLAVGLLRELESTLPKMRYIAWQIDRKDKDELADNACESLLSMGKSAVQPMLEALPRANAAGREALFDILSHYPGNARVTDAGLALFDERPARRAVLAGGLGRLGDERALAPLIAAALSEDVDYLTYIELRSAIEALGGDAPEREFSENDPTFDALQQLQ